jgi:predicted XRE-type DNA-binding protein
MANEAEGVVIEASSGNVYADLGLPNSEDRLAKAALASAITDAVELAGLTDSAAAALMGLDRTTYSSIVEGRLGQFSTERLLHLLLRLGLDVEIVVHRKTNVHDRPGTVSVAFG